MPITTEFDDLEEAADARIIAEAPGSDLSYLFTHDLVGKRCATRSRPPPHADACAYCRRAGTPYQGREIEHHLAELARHFRGRRTGRDPDKAIDYSIRAGRRSLDQLAYEEAARHFAAIKVLEGKDVLDQLRLCGVASGFGRSSKAGRTPRFRSRRFSVRLTARGIGASDQKALAAIAFEWLTWSIGKPDATACSSVQRSGSHAFRSTAPCERSFWPPTPVLQGLGFAEQAAKHAREAVELARQVGSRRHFAMCWSWCCT